MVATFENGVNIYDAIKRPSRIIEVFLFPSQRVPGLAQAIALFVRTICADAPIERIVLRIANAERESDLGLGQFGAEIEGVSAIGLDVEVGNSEKAPFAI